MEPSSRSIQQILTQSPDFGTAVEELLHHERIALLPTTGELEISDELSITDVHEQLLRIAREEGAGGVARKQQLALQLLQQCRYDCFQCY